jgi:hypothetical protein
MNIGLPPGFRRLVGLGVLLVSIFGSAAFATYLLANYVSGVTLPFFPAWLSREIMIVIICIGFGASFVLTRGNPTTMHPYKERIIPREETPKYGTEDPTVAPPWYHPPKQQTTQPTAPTSLEAILERALVNNLLGSDLNVTLKLPPNTKLKIMGQDWEVNNAKIVIAKKQSPPNPMVPLEAPEYQETSLQ